MSHIELDRSVRASAEVQRARPIQWQWMNGPTRKPARFLIVQWVLSILNAWMQSANISASYDKRGAGP